MPSPEIPPSSTQSTPAEFAESVGRAVLAWRDIEHRSANLYVWLLDARNAQGAITSFYAVHSMTVRAMMLKTAAHHMFQSPDMEDLGEEFDTVMDQLAECSRLRNRLSHSEVAEELTDEGWSYSLKTPEQTALAIGIGRGGKVKTAPLDFLAIKGAEGQFRRVAEAMFALEQQLRERLESL
jgi:hypothetical protein